MSEGPRGPQGPVGPARPQAPPDPTTSKTTSGPQLVQEPTVPPSSVTPGPPPDQPGSSDRVMLEGPHSRMRELLLLWRALLDFVRGFRVLHFAGPCVTVFGSARFSESHPYYAIAREVGRRLSLMGFTVMTGGGPGLMEATNRGAQESGGLSVGCNIELPHEQDANAYLDKWVTCHYFFVRKVLLFKYSYAFIALPGGLGTLDELAEALTLIQTKKISSYPVILIGTGYWAPFITLLQDMIRQGAVSPADLDLFLVTDDLDQAMKHLETHAVTPFGLQRVRRPSRWLGERAPQRRPGTPAPEKSVKSA